MVLWSVYVICGFNIGLQYEEIDEEKYLIVNLGIIELIFTW